MEGVRGEGLGTARSLVGCMVGGCRGRRSRDTLASHEQADDDFGGGHFCGLCGEEEGQSCWVRQFGSTEWAWLVLRTSLAKVSRSLKDPSLLRLSCGGVEGLIGALGMVARLDSGRLDPPPRVSCILLGRN